MLPLQKNGRLSVILLMLGLIAVLVWQTGEWLRSPENMAGAQRWQNVECSFGAVQPDAGAWQACKLPHNWDIQKPDYSGDAWYRLSLPAQHDPSHEQALWMFANMNAELWLNDIKIGSGGSMQEPVSRHWNDALFFAIPTALLNQQSNELVIRVHGYANNSSGLSMLMTGSYERMRTMHQRVQFRSHLLTYGSLVVVMLVGFLTLIMWIWHKQTMLIYFSLGCLTSSLYLLDQVIVTIPVTRDLWEIGSHLSIIFSQMFFLLFLTHFLHINKGWMTTTLFAYGCLGALILPNIDSVNLIIVATLWEGISLVFLVMAILYLFHRWYAEGIYFAFISGLALASVLMAFLHDWLPFVLGQGVSPPFLYYMGSTDFVMIMAGALMVRLSIAYRYEQAFSAELGNILWHSSKELEDIHRNADAMIKNQAALKERDRIVRELHDGVGGLLANTLAIVKPSDSHLRAKLSEALDELRMMMGTLDEDADISSLLGLHRAKLQAAIEAANGELHWEFYDIPVLIQDNASNGMQLVRIVQECVYNALRHGQATDITVHIDQSQCWVSDNGCGFDLEHIKSGRGLKNMRWRAEQLNASFNLCSNASGTKISLFWKK